MVIACEGTTTLISDYANSIVEVQISQRVLTYMTGFVWTGGPSRWPKEIIGRSSKAVLGPENLCSQSYTTSPTAYWRQVNVLCHFVHGLASRVFLQVNIGIHSTNVGSVGSCNSKGAYNMEISLLLVVENGRSLCPMCFQLIHTVDYNHSEEGKDHKGSASLLSP